MPLRETLRTRLSAEPVESYVYLSSRPLITGHVVRRYAKSLSGDPLGLQFKPGSAQIRPFKPGEAQALYRARPLVAPVYVATKILRPGLPAVIVQPCVVEPHNRA